MRSSTKRVVPFNISLLLLLLLLTPMLIYSQSRIQGQVYGLNRRPISDTYVELLNDVEVVVQRAKTDGGGMFIFVVNTPGRYYVKVRPFGTNYEEQTQEVEINTFIGGRQVADYQQRDFHLKERKNPQGDLGAPGVVFQQVVPTEAKLLYDKALVNINAERRDLAITELRSAIEIFPTYFDALYQMGMEMLKQQKYTEAVGYLERSVAVHNRSSFSWHGLAFGYYALNQAPKAVDAAEKAVSFGPQSTENNLILGLSLRKAKQITKAEKALLKAKKLSDGKSPDVLWNLALLYAYDLKSYRQAADELENYLKVKPDHPDAKLLKKLILEYRTKN